MPTYYLHTSHLRVQRDPHIALMKDGTVLGVWEDIGNDPGVYGGVGVYAALKSADGKQGSVETRIPAEASGDQMQVGVATFANGNFMVTYQSNGPSARNGQDDGYYEVYAKFYRPDGSAIGKDKQLTPALKNDHWNGGVVSLSNNQSITLVSREDTGDHTFIAYRHAADGTQIGKGKVLVANIDVFVNSLFGTEYPSPSIAAGKGGQYIVSWQEQGPNGQGIGNYQIHAQAFRADGSKIGSEQVVAPVVRHKAEPLGLAQEDPHIIGRSGGGYAMIYTRAEPDSTYDSDVYLRLLNSTGVPTSGHILVNGDRKPGEQGGLDVVDLGAGHTMVVYEIVVDRYPDESTIMGRVFGPDGKALTKSLSMAAERFQDFEGGNTIINKAGQVLTSFSGEYNYGDSDDAFMNVYTLTLPKAHGTGKADKMAGTMVNDQLYGRGGSDVLRGETGNDSLLGGAGADRLIGGSGNDRLQGEAGNDWMAGGSGQDFLNGGSGHDRILGGAGDDQLRGRAGNDSMNGGSGNDHIFGDSGNDVLAGGAAADRLQGGKGNDTLRGGSGADSFVFGKEFDRDAIADFQNDVDTIVMKNGIRNFAEARSFATQEGKNVLFDFGGGDVLTIRGITVNALADDMVFG